MGPISNSLSNIAIPPAADVGAKEDANLQRSPEEAKTRLQKPVTDIYVPEEKQEPSGRYWIERGESGVPKIYFDDPGQSRETKPNAGQPQTDGPDAAPSKASPEAERCTGSTDAVDREIEKLKREREELKRQLSLETDENRCKALEHKLAQVERELSKKDNDTYRRQHTVFS